MDTTGAGLRDRLQQTLGGAYVLERELGGGGMSRVFVAHDTRLGRRIVVKVLHHELAAGLSAQRFEREIRLAAQLQHPHVVQLLNAGEVEGLPYYTMPFVQGESLRERLRREGALPVGDAVRLVRELADALAYAHAEGVVHRDLKPENVLLSGSHAVVADFGVAKAVSAATHGGGTAGESTGLGVAVGTPAYMAPEQATGDPATDHRADLYALGVVAYEILAGAHPFAGRAPTAMLAAHLTEMPASLAEQRPDVPAAVAALVMRLLAKQPGDRPQNATDVVRELDAILTPPAIRSAALPRARLGGRRTLVGVGIAVAVIGSAIAAATLAARRTGTSPDRPVLAVLPFENLGAPADAYFADGLTEEVRSRLTSVSGLQVIGGKSARQYKGTTRAPREIARELGATHLLSGTIRWERAGSGDGRIRVHPELVRASDQSSIWAEPVEGQPGDVFALQMQVAERVAAALDVALLARERQTISARPTENLAAYDAYLRGLASITRGTVFSAAERQITAREFERAVALDPNFAAAYARLAMVYRADQRQAGDAGTAATALAKGQAAVERAWALDSTLVETRIAHTTYLADAGDVASAYRLVRDAARSFPGNVELLITLGNVEWTTGRHDEALASYRRATTLDPRAAPAWGQLAGRFDQLYQHADAVKTREREIALAPDTEVAYAAQAASYLLWRADTTEARRTLERAGQAPQWIVRFPGGIAGGAIWAHALPPAVMHARDTLTLAGYLAGPGGVAPELFHLMKLRHLSMTGRMIQARRHADSIVSRIAPALRREPDAPWFFGWFTRRSAIAEAYATLGQTADAAREADRYVDETRNHVNASRPANPEPLCHVLHNAAYIDVSIGRRDLAIARLAEALRYPCGIRVSQELLKADPTWASLRGHPEFERLVGNR